MEEFRVQEPDEWFLLGMTENGQKPVYGAARFIVVLAGQCIQSKHRFGERDDMKKYREFKTPTPTGRRDMEKEMASILVSEPVYVLARRVHGRNYEALIENCTVL